jgi:hypothetical protein
MTANESDSVQNYECITLGFIPAPPCPAAVVTVKTALLKLVQRIWCLFHLNETNFQTHMIHPDMLASLVQRVSYLTLKP